MTSRPLDICFVLPSLEIGGAERVTVNLLNGLHAQGQAPRLLLTHREGSLRAELTGGIPVVTLGRPRVRSALPEVLSRLRRRPPDVVLSTHTHVNLVLCGIRPLLGRRTRLVIREPLHSAPPSVDVPSWVRRLKRVLYPRADLLLVTSEAMEKDLASLTGTTPVILPNAVDVARVRGVAAQGLSSAPGVDEGPSITRRFVAVGRLVPQKAYDDLLEAFAVASGPGDRLEIFGDGPLRDHVAQLIATLGLAERVSLAGNCPDHWPRVARADALILTSTHEGMPNAVLEALALGTPVLATTDLDVLEGLRISAAPGAVTLVPRSELAAAMRAINGRQGASAELMKPNLLPTAFDSMSVSRTLVTLLTELVSDPRTGAA